MKRQNHVETGDSTGRNDLLIAWLQSNTMRRVRVNLEVEEPVSSRLIGRDLAPEAVADRLSQNHRVRVDVPCGQVNVDAVSGGQVVHDVQIVEAVRAERAQKVDVVFNLRKD